ncbi:MAG TPA: hypothetical protein VEQ67_18625 [Mycobacterium sp.]|nr:hypothetical protein [Mycobacterium sp.]
MKVLTLRRNVRSVMIVALMLIVIVAVIFGIDLINGRWDQPLIQDTL